MNENTDFDRIAQSWLQDGPTEMPDRSLQAALDEVHVTSQQRFGAARRTLPMNGNAFRLAAAAVVALAIVVVGGIYLGNNQSGEIGGQPSATPTPIPTPSPTPTAAPSEVVDGPGTYRLGSVGHVGSPPASILIDVPTGWTADGPIVGKANRDIQPLVVVWQMSNRFNHPCTDHTLLSPAPGPGVDELIEALASQPGITAGPIMDVTVDGYSGKSVELTVATDILTCGAGDDGFWLWASPDGDRRYVQASDEMDRIYALDVDGTRFTFNARLPADATAEERAELEAIIASMDIEPTLTPSPTP